MASTQNTLESVAGLTSPITLEQFRSDATNVFLHYVRNIAWMVDTQTAWAITKAPALEFNGALANPELMATDLGLTYEHIQNTEFARAMQRMYDYAYFGKLDLSQEEIGYESIHTWITALVVDVAGSAVGAEWDSYGLDILSCASRCAQVAETANARVTLEGEDPFFYHFKANPRDDFPEEGVLTVRQMSLLSGMEEMSIRAAANPKRVNRLKPVESTEKRTLFEIQVAKDWLLSKKRYVQITKRWSAGEMNLHKKRFANLVELDMGLNARYKMLCNEHGRDSIDDYAKALGLSSGEGLVGPYLTIDDEDFANQERMRGLARVLCLPEDLLVLRIEEVLASERLRSIERSIKQLTEQ